MVLTPFATRATAPLMVMVGRWRGAVPMEPANLPTLDLAEHIIIAGYGRVGRYTADVLQRLGLPFVILERDQRRVDELKAAGLPVIYGDASSPGVLEAAGLQHARLVLVVVSAAIDVELVVRQVRHMHPALHIVARAARLGQLEALRAVGYPRGGATGVRGWAGAGAPDAAALRHARWRDRAAERCGAA